MRLFFIFVFSTPTQDLLMSSKEYKMIILQKLKDNLCLKGFKKNGSNFKLTTNDLTYYIGLQSSQSSTASVLKITINTEIASAAISKIDDISIPVQHQRHYTRRIGNYLSPPSDLWWTIESTESAELAASEIISLLEKLVLPNFDSLKSIEDMVSLWLSKNGYFGITEGQRKRYLHLLGY